MGWRRDGNTPHIPAPALFTFYFSLFTFHFPKGPLPLSQCTAVRCPMQRAASAVAVHCIRHRTALRFPTYCCQSPCAAFFTFHFSLFTYIMHRTAFSSLLLSESPRSIFPAFIGCFPVNAGGGWPVRAVVLTRSSSFPSLFDVCGCWCRRGWLGSIFQPVSPPPDTRPAG